MESYLNKPSLASRFAQGFGAGSAINQQIQQNKLQNQQYQATQADLDAMQRRNNITGKIFSGDYSSNDMLEYLALSNKEERESMEAGLSQISETDKDNTAAALTPILSALNGGDSGTATTLLEQYRAGFENSGQEDRAKTVQTVIDSINKGGVSGAKTAEMMIVTQLAGLGREGIIDSVIAYNKERRDQTVSEANLLKMGTELGLKGDAAKDAYKIASNMGQEGAKTVLNYAALAQEQGGDLTTSDRFDFETELSADYQKSIGDYNDVLASYNAVQGMADLQTGAGDQALIVLFNKMLDPGSVVRESEAAATMNSTGVTEKLKASINRLATGEKLGDGLRADLLEATKKLMESSGKIEERARERLMFPVKNYDLNPENIFGAKADPRTVSTTEPVVVDDQVVKDALISELGVEYTDAINNSTIEELEALQPTLVSKVKGNTATTNSVIEVDF